MKTIAISLSVVFGAILFTSCQQCKICTKDESPEVRVCEKDYGSSTEYGFAIDVLESQGYNCSGSL